MFNPGEYVVYGSKGVCIIDEISHVDMPGATKDKLYYIMTPVSKSNGKVYLAIDSDKAVIRNIMEKAVAEALLKEMPEIEEFSIVDDKRRELEYKEAMKQCDPKIWVGMIKTLTARRARRIELGKKITSLDERYLKAAQTELCGELSVVLEKTAEETDAIIKDRLGL